MANRFLTTGSVKRIEQRGVELEDGLGAPETVPVGSDGTEIAGVLGEVQANPTANTLLGRLKALETAFATLLAKLSTDPLPAGDNNIGNVDVVTMPNVIVGSSALPTGAATSAKQDALAALVGSVSDAAVTDPTLSGSEIALLKGLLKQMQGNGTGTLPVNVSGGVVISGDTTLAGTVLMRDATDPAKLAKVDANGNQLVTVSGSNITDSGAIPVVQAHKDVVARAIDNIIDIVGAENIKLFLPLWETSGNKAYDLLDRSLQFDINGASFSTGGLFGNCLTLDGINDYLRQTPIAENASGGSFYNLTNPAYKIATRMAGFTGKIAAVQLNLKITGTINSAVLTASIYTDNSGVPGTLVATSNPLTCSQFPSVVHPVAFTFSTPYEVKSVSKYWIVLEYSTDTGVDESNYISWACEDMNTYGETMAIYDGANWNARTGNCVFSVSNDALKCDADWTIIAACLPQNWSLWGNYALYNGSSGKPISPTFYVYWQYLNQIIDWRFSGNDRVKTGTANFPLISQNMFTIITQTFSKSASIGKSKLYVNNRLQASMDGNANVGNSLAGLLYLGVAQSNTGGFSSYWKGRLGPVMLLSKELTIAEIDKVTSNLFALRKLGVAI